MAKDAFAKMDVQFDLFMKTTQPQKKWEKEELLKDYAAIMKQLQPGQGKQSAGEQWAMTKSVLYKEDRVCVPESHLEETLRWCHTVNDHPAVQRSLWFFDRHFHCNKNESEKKKLMTALTKDCHCIMGKRNSQVDRGEMGNLPIPHTVNSVVYLDFMHLPHYAGQNFALLVTCGLSRFARVFPTNKKADSETVPKTLFEEWLQVYGLSKPNPLRSRRALKSGRQLVPRRTRATWLRDSIRYALSAHQERAVREANPLLQNSDADPHGAGEMEELVESATVRNIPDDQPGVHAYCLLTARPLLRSSWFPHGVSTPQDANPKLKGWMEKQAALASTAKELLQKFRECENTRSKRGRKAVEYQIGDMVVVHHKRLPRWEKNDLDLPYYGPCMVTDVGPSSVKVRASRRFGGDIEVGFPFLERYTLMDEYDLDLKGFDDKTTAEEDELNDDQDEDMTSELNWVREFALGTEKMYCICFCLQ